MKVFKVRLPVPPSPFLYYIDMLDSVSEIGESYQKKVRVLIYPDPTSLESLIFHLLMSGGWGSIKLDVTVYPEKEGKQRLDWIMEVLIDTLYTIGTWEIHCEVMEQNIRNGGSIGGYMDVKISESKIQPIGLIDGPGSFRRIPL